MIVSLLAIALQSSTWVIPPLPTGKAATPVTSESVRIDGPPNPTQTSEPGTGKVSSVVVGAPGIGWTKGPDPVRCAMTGMTTGSKIVPVVKMRPAAADGSVSAAITDPGSAWQFVRVDGSPDADTWIAGAVKRYGAGPAVVLKPEKGNCRYEAVVVYSDDDGEFVGSKDRPRLSPIVQCPPLSCLRESIDKLRANNQPRQAMEMTACSDQKLHPTNKAVIVAYDRTSGTETVSVVDRAVATRSYFTGVSPYSCLAGQAK
jgi:hypothetical protein